MNKWAWIISLLPQNIASRTVTAVKFWLQLVRRCGI